MPEFGVYIHFPWCRSRCPYCDFAIAISPLADIPHTSYTDALLAELSRQAPRFRDRDLVSIYLGGGTPSLWEPSELSRAVSGVLETFTSDALREVTLEANPADCTPSSMSAWRAAGVTRLSIGVQSTDDRDLVSLGRDHRMGDGRAAVSAALTASFASLSADVIAGAPGPTDGGISSARALADLGAPHLSVYELTIEPNAPLARAVERGEVTPRSDDELADTYIAIHDHLTARGYDHYEISSYALPGHRAVHNSLYWRCAEFLGLGNGAASFLRHPDGSGQRWTNPRAVARYLAGGAPEIDTLSRLALAADRIWLGLRTSDGVELGAFEHFPRLPAELSEGGLAVEEGGRIRPTLRGFLQADRVARRVLAA